MTWSSLASKPPGVAHPNTGRKRVPWGVLIHTTGRGVLAKAALRRKTPMEVAVRAYIDMQFGSEGYKWGGPTYVIDGGGKIAQLAPDSIRTNHCGGPNRAKYLSGEWKSLVPGKVLELWTKAWAPRPHPYSLFPSRSPNEDMIGIELIPTITARYTDEQMAALAELVQDIGERNRFPDGWCHTSRLLGHEDVDPITRSDRGGGYDPGALRDNPRFDFETLRVRLSQHDDRR